jgi:hypothetical protein
MADYAANTPDRSWLCGYTRRKGELKKDGKPKWDCSHKWAFDYYALLDENGQVIKSSYENDLKPEGKQKVEKKHYDGCPRWNRAKSKIAAKKDDFDF